MLQGHIYVCALCTCIKYINTCMYIFKKKCFVCILNIYIQYTCISKYRPTLTIFINHIFVHRAFQSIPIKLQTWVIFIRLTIQPTNTITTSKT